MGEWRRGFGRSHILRTEGQKGKGNTTEKLVQDPTSRRGLPKLTFQILLLGAEPSVRDALAIFLSMKKEVCKQ